jgi:hypothetical protein
MNAPKHDNTPTNHMSMSLTTDQEPDLEPDLEPGGSIGSGRVQKLWNRCIPTTLSSFRFTLLHPPVPSLNSRLSSHLTLIRLLFTSSHLYVFVCYD